MRILFVFALAFVAFAADYRAGAARVDITPEGPVWMSGYASRSRPSEGVLQRIHAKALALEDRKGSRVVIVTTDLVGLPRVLTDLVGARVEKEFRLERARLLLNSSHTHTGPVVRPNLSVMYDLTEEQDRKVREYSQQLANQLVQVIGQSLTALKPASLSFGTGAVTFAMNRRERTPAGTVRIGTNPEGPVDHSVPVLRVSGEDGRPLAVLFGYACHNTTLTGEHYKISGDYAGAAQIALERDLPGATAMFLELCAGDQNPSPRGQEVHVDQHGGALAAEVRRVLDTKPAPVRGDIKAALEWRDLPLQAHAREDFEKMLGDKDPIRVRFARSMLQAYDERRPLRSVPFPVQAIRLGRDMGIVALGGEPVVSYALQAKAAHPKLRLMVAGYSNDVMGYLPTARMLEEGGYEPIQSALYYGLPAPFAPEVEQLVMEAIRSTLRRVSR